MNCFIGIDLGTSSVKITAININGKILQEEKVKYSINKPSPDWAEQSPEIWWKSTKDALKNIIVKLKNNDSNSINIKSIGVTGQMHGLVTIDKFNQILYPAIIWADNRTNKELKTINDILSKKEKNELANPIANSFTAPKILWLKNNIKNFNKEIHKIMLPKDYIVYKLTGEIYTEKSDASATLLYDIKNKEWNKNVINKLNIPIDILPEVLTSGSKVGEIKSSVASEVGLEYLTSIITCGGDAPISTIANGVIEPGTACVSLGTAGQIILPIKDYFYQKDGKLHTMVYPMSDLWYLMGAILSAGYSLSWWLKDIMQIKESENNYLIKNNDKIKNIFPGSDGLIFLPYIQGERSPINDPNATGVFFGMNSIHNSNHFIRAIMEGVAFAIKANLELIKEIGAKFNKIIFTGGGSKNKLWLNIFASVLNHEVYQANKDYGAAYGAAIISAKTNNTKFEFEKILKQNFQNYTVISPEKAMINNYKKIYPLYKKLYLNNKDEMNIISQFRR